ncbi:MAG: glycosyltransferase family 39 protein [Rubripirellula sp.]|nr:glycosyltransferase family 39 protein [Rubripirellula sp.]
MLDGIVRKPQRLIILLACYFATQVAIRVALSDSLDIDESEQIFLSQWLQLGYNAQPPFYNWTQTLLLHFFGPSVFILSALKNSLLFLTYICYFSVARLITRDNGLAAVATLGLLTIPQIAWESQRDLAHTVAATFAASAFIYGVFRTLKTSNVMDYVFTGVAIGIALTSKYNTILLIACTLTALVSMREYRWRVLSPKIIYSVVPALLIVTPHFLWVLDNLQLASGTTIAKASINSGATWSLNVITGFVSLLSAILNFNALLMIVFLIVFGRTFLKSTWADSPEIRLLNRTFGITLIILTGLVLTGKVTDFKDRWLQPVLFLLPLYSVLKMNATFVVNQRLKTRFAAVAVTLMLAVSVGLVVRTTGASMTGRYCRLNIPYADVSRHLIDETGEIPKTLVTNDYQVAGNLRMQFPATRVVSTDMSHLGFDLTEKDFPMVILSPRDDTKTLDELLRFAGSLTGKTTEPKPAWKTPTIPYLYSAGSETVSMTYTIRR